MSRQINTVMQNAKHRQDVLIYPEDKEMPRFFYTCRRWFFATETQVINKDTLGHGRMKPHTQACWLSQQISKRGLHQAVMALAG